MFNGVGEVVFELLTAVERYRSRPAVELDGAQLGEELVGLRHAVDLLEVEFAKLSGRFAETDEWDDGGFLGIDGSMRQGSSPKGWISPSPSSARPASTSGTPPTRSASRWRSDRRRRSASSR